MLVCLFVSKHELLKRKSSNHYFQTSKYFNVLLMYFDELYLPDPFRGHRVKYQGNCDPQGPLRTWLSTEHSACYFKFLTFGRNGHHPFVQYHIRSWSQCDIWENLTVYLTIQDGLTAKVFSESIQNLCLNMSLKESFVNVVYKRLCMNVNVKKLCLLQMVKVLFSHAKVFHWVWWACFLSNHEEVKYTNA